MENSKISWTNHTFNPWIGCTRVSPGCVNCYAENLMDHRYHKVEWGPGKPRVLTSDANWKNPVKWNKQAAKAGARAQVFCASLADALDDEAPSGAREKLWKLIESTPHLDWQLLTKRPQNFSKYLPWGPNEKPWPNIWLGTSTEDEKWAKERIPLLRAYPAAVRFISAEPLLGDLGDVDLTGIGWTIIGGESGKGARNMQIEWARSLLNRAHKDGSKVWVKQMGEVWAKDNRKELIQIAGTKQWSRHGADMATWPADLQVQELPTPNLELDVAA